MKRKLLILPVLLLLSILLPAQDLRVQDSLSTRFFRLNFPDRSKSLNFLTIDTSFTYRNLTFYNFSAPSGFVILRDAGERYDIVGYEYGQNFSFEVDTTGFLLALANSLADQTDIPGYEPAKIQTSLKTGRYAVEPLIKTAWNQGWPYNVLCPADPELPDEDNRAVVGCVAVAMAQIIRYYDKWNDFAIYYSYQHPVYGTLTCNSGHYDWVQMENSCYSINYEVAKLLYDCGVLVNMNYSHTGSGASSGDAAARFQQIYHNGYLNNTLESEGMFFDNISNYRPIYATYPGHAFVCDGFDGSSFYHFNLGWGGSANGYYSLSNVLNHALTSAIFNAFPDLPAKPPRRMQKFPVSEGKIRISWTGPDQDRSMLAGYRIYLDDRYLTDSPDTVFIHDCIPGEHYLKVSAQFQTGESRWIGPASYFFDGSPVTIPDATLKRALNSAIGIASSQLSTHSPTEGEMRRISRLNISNATNLEGIGHCINLKQLVLFSSTRSRTLDMELISGCAGLAILSIENYRITNQQALAGLTKLTDLRLYDNQLEELEFLKSLSLITRLEIRDNTIPDISFLNQMERVEWLVLKNCGITGFDALNNSYGLRSVDISNNQVESLNWLNRNTSLQYLNAASNKLSGSIHLSGIPVLLTIDVSANSLTGFRLTGSPGIETINLSNNKITDIDSLLTDNPNLATLTAHHNLIPSIPAVSTNLTRLELQNNLITDVAQIKKHFYLTYLNLSNNKIVDLTGLTDNDFHKQLTYLNLQNNPISRQSFLEIIPVIRMSGQSSILPAQFHPGSPCYLVPAKDTSMMSRRVRFSWQADYNNEGYDYSVFLSRDGDPFTEIASGLTTRSLDYETPVTGKYSWYVVAEKDSLALKSRAQTFKVMKAFSVPFSEDFELYSMGTMLCAQSPFWKIYDPSQDPAKDAIIINTRALEGEQSIKISGSADIWFPVSDYLAGTCNAEFSMMVDKSRKAFVQVILSGGSTISLYFFSEGILDVYLNDVLFKHTTFKVREWMKVSVSFTAPSDFKVYLDSQVISEGKDQNSGIPGLSGIRFGTRNGPGYYQSLPFVFYVDNFAITSGTALSADNPAFPAGFPAAIVPNGNQVILKDIAPSIRKVTILSSDGRLIHSCQFSGDGNVPHDIPIPIKGNMIIVVLVDSSGRTFYKKIAGIF